MLARPHPLLPSLPSLPAPLRSGAGRRPREIRLAWGIPLAITVLLFLAGLQAIRALRPAWSARIEYFIADARAEPASDPPPAAAVADLRLAAFTPEVRRWSAHILRWASDYDLPPELVATVMQIESCGAPGVRSPAGAAGLFQVMPFHFEASEDPFEIETNAARGLAYLARGLDLAGGRADLALAGYNGGHGLIARDPATWPRQTQRYVHWGTGILQDVERGGSASPTLQAWLDAGGKHLCQRAADTRLASD
ncbi:MAG: transglycosylase SLT domain-containing protein [Anaerolineales bacterium]|nr:transglycosylase SLT domain-containing protein [Anaerolineales bacterium]